MVARALCLLFLVLGPTQGVLGNTPSEDRPAPGRPAALPAPLATPGPRTTPAGVDAGIPGAATGASEGRWRPDVGRGSWRAWYHRRQDAFETWSAQAMATLVEGGVRIPTLPAPPPRADGAARAQESLGGALTRAGEDPWVLAAAVLAYAKVAHGPTAAEVLLGLASAPPGTDPFVEERATLALGLLRRTDPRLRLSGERLDAVRDRLFSRYVEPGAPPRVRALAALSLGLLGDQPSGDGTPEGDAIGRAATTRRLHAVLQAPAAYEELPASVLIALGAQRPDSASPSMLPWLADLAHRGRLGGREVVPGLVPWGIHAFGRLAGAGALPGLGRAARSREDLDGDLPRAVLWALLGVGLGSSGEEPSSAPVRVGAARVVLEVAGKAPEEGVRHAAALVLGRLLAADRVAGDDAVHRSTAAGDHLLRRLADGREEERSFAALAVGLALRPGLDAAAPPSVRAFHRRGQEALARGAEAPAGPTSHRAACALALGLGGVADAQPRLLALAISRAVPGEVRAYALLGLGHLGRPAPETLRALAAGLSASQPPLVRVEAAAALGLLRRREGGVDGPLCREIRRLGSLDAAAQAFLALTPDGRAGGVAALADLLDHRAAPPEVRALAATGLGVLADPEPRSSLDVLRADTDPVAPTLLLEELAALP